MVISKSSLAVELSKLDIFLKANVKLEQYPTDSQIAGDMLWNAYMLGDIEGRDIIDLGAGTGILSIGAKLLGANKMFLVDVDASALDIAKKSLEKYSKEEYFDIEDFNIFNKNIKDKSIIQDLSVLDKNNVVLLQNPPFGTRETHADKEFLKTALEVSDIVYSFHKTSTIDFLIDFASKKGFVLTHKFNYKFPLKQTFSHHTKKIHRIDVSCLRFQRRK